MTRHHEKRQDMKEAYAASPDVDRKISSPEPEDMATLAKGEEIELDVTETEIDTEGAVDVDTDRPPAPGGSADPGVYDDD